MLTIERSELNAVWAGGDGDSLPGAGDDFGMGGDPQTSGKCGPGQWSYGVTPECGAHDQCVEQWNRVVGRPAADAICLPKLPAAIGSAVRCAADPYCPK
jgi:hypothetical protein